MRFSERSERAEAAALALTDIGAAGAGWGLAARARADSAAGRRVAGAAPIVACDDTAPFAAPEAALDAAHRALDARGPAVLAEAAERRARFKALVAARRAAPVEPARVVLAPRLSALLGASVATWAETEDEVVVFDPGEPWIAAAVIAAGATPVWARLSAREGFQISADAVADAIDHPTRALVLPTPNDPTGRTVDAAAWGQLAALAERRDLVVISVAAAAGLTPTERQAPPPAALARLADRFVTLEAAAPCFGGAPWELAWGVFPSAQAAGRARALLRLWGLEPNAAALAGALVAVERGRGAADRARASLKRRAELAGRVIAAAARAPGAAAALAATRYDGGLYLLIDARVLARRLGLGAAELAEGVLAEAIYEETGVALADGALYGEGALGFLRFSLGLDDELVAEAAARLARLVAP